MRLIDADALMKNIGKIPQLRGITYGRMKKAVEETPTIDAVPVVLEQVVEEGNMQIQQLEAANAELLTKVKQLESKCRQLERDRDADAVDAMPRWISVEERLPEDQRDVLTVNGHGYIRMMGLFHKRGEQWTWLHDGRFKHYNDVTHWMPLPQTPKEADNA